MCVCEWRGAACNATTRQNTDQLADDRAAGDDGPRAGGRRAPLRLAQPSRAYLAHYSNPAHDTRPHTPGSRHTATRTRLTRGSVDGLRPHVMTCHDVNRMAFLGHTPRRPWAKSGDATTCGESESDGSDGRRPFAHVWQTKRRQRHRTTTRRRRCGPVQDYALPSRCRRSSASMKASRSPSRTASMFPVSKFRPQVLDQLIRGLHVGPDLAPPAHLRRGPARAASWVCPLARLAVQRAWRRGPAWPGLVLELAALVLAGDHDARSGGGSGGRRSRSVHVLAAGTR